MPSTLIRGGRLIDPASATDAILDVAIARGRIAAIAKDLPRADADHVIDAGGRIVAPGLIDPHVHLREPGHEHKETIATGTRAAVAGGFTTVCCMPNTSPAIDSPEMVRFVHDRASTLGKCRVFPVAAATRARRGEDIAEIALMAREGVAGFSDDGDCVASASMMARIFAAVAPTDLAFMQHCQEPTLTRGASMHAGEVAVRLGLGGWPRDAEEIIVERDLRLLRRTDARYHVQHISSGDTVDLIRRARSRGQRVTGEASPHHLHLTHEACDGYATAAKVNPPLREWRDVKALREGVADGTITVLATDHAPHSEDEKSLAFEDAPFGLIGLESALPLYAEALVATGLIDWPRLIALLSIEPARLCNLDPSRRGKDGLGVLQVGGVADLTIIDPDLAWTLTRESLAGASTNTPFLGRALAARAVMTIVAGDVRFRLEG
jgi:dihydroorotase